MLYACLFVVMVGYGSTLTVLPYHTQRIGALADASAGALALQVGLLTSAYAFAQLITGPFAGRLGDRIGRRATLLCGLLGLAAAQAAFGLTTSLPLLYLLRFLGGVATACLIVAATTYVADRTSERDRARGMAWFGSTVSLGLVAGPTIAAVLSQPGVDVGRGAFRIDGYSIPFLFSGALAAAVYLVARRVLPESRGETSVAPPVEVNAAGNDPGYNPGMRTLLSLVAASQYGLAIFEATFVLYARDRLSLGAGQTSLAFAVCGAVMAVLQVPAASTRADGVSPLARVALGFALMGTGITAILFVHAFPLLLAVIAVLAAGAALIIPNLSALVSTQAGTSIGLALGWKNSASSLGQFLGPLIGGALLGWQEDLPFLAAGALLLVVAAVLAFRRRAPAKIYAAERTVRRPVGQSLSPRHVHPGIAIVTDSRRDGDDTRANSSAPTPTSRALGDW